MIAAIIPGSLRLSESDRAARVLSESDRWQCGRGDRSESPPPASAIALQVTVRGFPVSGHPAAGCHSHEVTARVCDSDTTAAVESLAAAVLAVLLVSCG
jgi:hypothetical protein